MTNTTDQSDKSIVRGPAGRDIDVMTTLNQMGFWTRARIGFVVGSVLYDRDWFKFQISCGGRRKKWVVIKLAASDTYLIEVAHLVKRINYVIDAQREDVYAEDLSRVMEELFQEVYA